MASLQEIYELINSAARGELTYEEFDRRLGFSFYELPVDIVRSQPATFVSLVVERMEFVKLDRTPEEVTQGFESPDQFLDWLGTSWREEEARIRRSQLRAI
jgi:hypothetical protein